MLFAIGGETCEEGFADTDQTEFQIGRELGSSIFEGKVTVGFIGFELLVFDALEYGKRMLTGAVEGDG